MTLSSSSGGSSTCPHCHSQTYTRGPHFPTPGQVGGVSAPPLGSQNRPPPARPHFSRPGGLSTPPLSSNSRALESTPHNVAMTLCAGVRVSGSAETLGWPSSFDANLAFHTEGDVLKQQVVSTPGQVCCPETPHALALASSPLCRSLRVHVAFLLLPLLIKLTPPARVTGG